MVPEKARHMSVRPALWTAGSSVLACCLLWTGWGIRLYWNDARLVNFLAAWIPFVLSTLLAFVPEHKMTTTKKWLWRTSVMLVGLSWSIVLWHQQVIADRGARNDQTSIVASAVDKSNAHSDEKIGEVRRDVQAVKTDVGGVKAELSDTRDALVKKFGQSVDDIIGKVGKPQLAHVLFTFWPAKLEDWPITAERLPLVNGAVEVNLSFQAMDHVAKGLRIWIRLGMECSYGREPALFQNLHNTGVPTERMLVVGDLLPGTAYAPITFTIITPPKYDGTIIGANYACENCELLNPDKPQTLTVWLDRPKQLLP
jgi:hypothetical protein